MAEMLLNKKGVDIVGVCDLHPDRVGKDMYEVVGIDRGDRAPVIINGDIDEVLTEGCCDVCLVQLTHSLKKHSHVLNLY